MTYIHKDSVGYTELADLRLDEHSVEADPMFADMEGLDFQVKPGSPALKLGFENFPMDRFGVVKPEFRKLPDQGYRTRNGYLHPEITAAAEKVLLFAGPYGNYSQRLQAGKMQDLLKILKKAVSFCPVVRINQRARIKKQNDK